MATYLVETPHSDAECLKALDALKDQPGEDLLSKTYLACSSGKHLGYAFLEGDSEKAVLNKLPEVLRSKARATKVERMSADQIRKYHEKYDHPHA